MLQKIIPYFEPYLAEGICIAFSGGADSSLLLKAACLARETAMASDPSAQVLPILAVIAQTRLHPHEDTLQARKLALSMGADCLVLEIDEFQDPRIMDNPKNRCFLCKKLLFSSIKKSALKQGRLHVFDGSNQSDTAEYRPGLAALKELGIKSPLLELGITKPQVRELSRNWGLSPPTSLPPPAWPPACPTGRGWTLTCWTAFIRGKLPCASWASTMCASASTILSSALRWTKRIWSRSSAIAKQSSASSKTWDFPM